MKNSIARKLNRKLNKIVLGFLAVTVFTACPGKSNNNEVTNQVVNGYVNCTNCGGILNGSEFLITESNEYNNLFVLRLGFSGTTYGYGPSQYQGPVAAGRGELLIQAGLAQGYCSIPAGSYSIGTLISGQYSAGIIQGLKLVASGPVSLVINMNVAQIASPNNRDQFNMLYRIKDYLVHKL